MTAPLSFRTLQYGSRQGQEADLLLATSALSAPVVVLLHGGFWRMPHGRDQLAGIAVDLAARGFAVWNVGYRRLGQPGGGWPGTLEDVATALDHLADLAAAGEPLELGRVVVCGHSAGGQLALWAAARRRPDGAFGPQRVTPCAAAGLAPLVDLRAAAAAGAGGGAVRELLGGAPERVPERYAAASPRELLPLGVPQLVLHGRRDDAVPFALSRDFVAAARERGDDVRLVELAEAGHMDFVDPASAAHAELLSWLEQVAPPG